MILSWPHTSVTAWRMCVYMVACSLGLTTNANFK